MEFLTGVMSADERQLFLVAVTAILTMNVMAVLLHFLYSALSEGALKSSIRSIVFRLDTFAADMENSDKKRTAIQEINSILGWRRVVIPAALIGYVIDAEVTAIRKMQQLTGANGREHE